jgi:hypothetical protein
MATKIFLGFQTFVWLGYGLYLVFQPDYLAEVAGVVASHDTALTEIRAMYGGLEAGIGLLALCGILKPSMTRPALLALLFLTGGLFSARLFGACLLGDFSVYTVGALGYEGTSALLSALLLRLPSTQPSTE